MFSGGREMVHWEQMSYKIIGRNLTNRMKKQQQKCLFLKRCYSHKMSQMIWPTSKKSFKLRFTT